MMKKYFLYLFFLISLSVSAVAQKVLPLYPDTIPNAIASQEEEVVETKDDGVVIISKITKPTIAVYLPAKRKSTGTAVIIFPGGGYWVNAYKHEGTDVAKQFAAMGVAAFVVKYRIPNDATMVNRAIGPLQDAQQAIKMVRENAATWGIDPQRIGVMGFSAGGHLASTAGTHFKQTYIPNASNTSLRPDFMILIYPVISFVPGVGHAGSAEQLLGKQPSQEKLASCSNELQVTAQTPPAFLVHATDDDGVSPLNSIVFYEALLKHKVPAELHLYQTGGHGFGMYIKGSRELWMERCENWLATNGWLKV